MMPGGEVANTEQVELHNPNGHTAIDATLNRTDDTASVNLWYPRHEQVKHIEIGLIDVRSSDGFRTHYDFDRDGWVIEQASTFSWESGDEILDEDWQEVAFVQSWARKKPGPGDAE